MPSGSGFTTPDPASHPGTYFYFWPQLPRQILRDRRLLSCNNTLKVLNDPPRLPELHSRNPLQCVKLYARCVPRKGDAGFRHALCERLGGFCIETGCE